MVTISIRLAAVAAAAVVAAGVAGTRIAAKRRKTPAQREQERRKRIHEFGRITDGTVIDAQELGEGDQATQLLHYTYDVGGVSYEASQDVTLLRQFIDLHTCRIGLPASVKYDPHNPGNSIVIAEGWSGLRKGPGYKAQSRA